MHMIHRTILFLQEHFSFYAVDELVGPVIMSVKSEVISSQEHMRIILRKKTGTSHEIIRSTSVGDPHSPSKMAKVT